MVLGAGSGPYSLMYREDLALSVKSAFPGAAPDSGLSLPHQQGPGCPTLPDGLQKARKWACN